MGEYSRYPIVLTKGLTKGYTRNVSYLTLYVGQFTFSTQLLTLNYLICVQLRTEEMEIKGIVTNKEEGNRKGVNFLS